MIQHHVHIRSTDQFNQVGVQEKNDRNEINRVDDHRVWLCIHVTFLSSIGKVFAYLLTALCSLNVKFSKQFFSCCWAWLHFRKGSSQHAPVIFNGHWSATTMYMCLFVGVKRHF